MYIYIVIVDASNVDSSLTIQYFNSYYLQRVKDMCVLSKKKKKEETTNVRTR